MRINEFGGDEDTCGILCRPHGHGESSSDPQNLKKNLATLMVYGILGPQLGIEPVPPALEAQSPNLWTTKKVLKFNCFLF